jgi:hypothetical protein
MSKRKTWWWAGIGFACGVLLRHVLPKAWPWWYEAVIVLGVCLAVLAIGRLRTSRGKLGA